MTAKGSDYAFNHTGFNAWAAERKLMAARCQQCGTLHLPPRNLCSHCYSAAVDWVELSGRGELTGFTWIYVGLPAMLEEGYDRAHPYCVGVVKLEEGPSISAQLVEMDEAEVSVGMKLEKTFVEQGSGKEKRTMLAFKKRDA